MGQHHSLSIHHSPSSNETHAVSNDIIPSPFESIIPPLFAVICSYLEWQDTHVLLRLSKRAHRMYDPLTCCNGLLTVDTSTFKQSFAQKFLSYFAQGRDVPSKNQLLFIQCINRLSLKLDLHHEHKWLIPIMNSLHQLIAEQTGEALASGSLRSLSILERCDLLTPSVIDSIQIYIASPKCQLEELHVQFRTHFVFELSSFMKQSVSLKYIHIECGTGEDIPVDTLLEHLPDSLEEFVIVAQTDLTEALHSAVTPTHPTTYHSHWTELLRSDEYLPLLRRYSICGYCSGNDERARVLATTVMRQTNNIRPIEYWRAPLSDFQQHHVGSLPLRELVFADSNRQQVLSSSSFLLSSPGYNLWSQLDRLSICLKATADDVTAFSVFTSHRSITELELTWDVKNCNRSAACQVELLADLPALRFLNLPTGMPSRSAGKIGRSPTTLFFVHICSKLEVLDVVCENMTMIQLEILLKAVPNCRQITLRQCCITDVTDQRVFMSTMLAAVLFYCTHVVLVKITHKRWVLRDEHVNVVRESFQSYPFDAQNLHDLVQVSLETKLCHRCDAATHLLLHQLRAAPRLDMIDLQIGSNLQAAVLLGMPRYRDAEQMRLHISQSINQSITEKSTVTLLKQCTERLRIPTSVASPLEQRRASLQRGSNLCRDQSLAARMIDRPINQSIEMDERIGVFGLSVNQAGLTGRERFEQYFVSKLTGEEQKTLAGFNRGEYTSCK